MTPLCVKKVMDELKRDQHLELTDGFNHAGPPTPEPVHLDEAAVKAALREDGPLLQEIIEKVRDVVEHPITTETELVRSANNGDSHVQASVGLPPELPEPIGDPHKGLLKKPRVREEKESQ